MQIDLNLRESIRLNELLKESMRVLRVVNDENYPHRAEDAELVIRLSTLVDAHWNK